MAKFGTKVKAYPLDETGPKVGFIIEEGVGDGKDSVQVGDSVVPLAYREPQDYDDDGPNGTYCHLEKS